MDFQNVAVFMVTNVHTAFKRIRISYGSDVRSVAGHEDGDIPSNVGHDPFNLGTDMPQNLVTDFELAAMHGVDAFIDPDNQFGSFFHFAQAIMRNVDEYKLGVKHFTNYQFRIRVKNPTSLAYLKPNDIVDVFATDVRGLFEPDE